MKTTKLMMGQWDGLSVLGAVAGIVLGWVSAVLLANPSALG